MRWPNVLNSGFLMAPESGDAPVGGSGEDTTKKTPEAKTTVTVNGKEVDMTVISQAVSLMNALQDPDTGKEIIETMARKTGLLDNKGEPTESRSKTEKAIEGLITKSLKAKLGKDYHLFADQVGSVLDDAVREMLDERFGEQAQVTSKNTWENHVDKFLESHTLTEDIQDKMKELSDEAPVDVSKLKNPQQYLTRLYKNAIDELGVEPPKSEHRTSRSNERSDDIPDFVEKQMPKDLTIDQAIDAAAKGIRYVR